MLGTHGDEGLVEAVEAEVPDEPAADERRNKPEVEVGNHQERGAAHHPEKHKTLTINASESSDTIILITSPAIMILSHLHAAIITILSCQSRG